MLIKQLESKMKLAFAVSIGSLVLALVISIVVVMYATGLVQNARKSIYVLSGGVPYIAEQTEQDVNRPVEYEGHISMFHNFFFNLPPDDDFMKANIAKSMYLIDKSGNTEYNNLKEKGYYNSILSSSSILSIRTDSVDLDLESKSFIFYGTQRIERNTSILYRQLITTGFIQDAPRSPNNPFGALIVDWKTILNKDIKNVNKKVF